MKKLVVLGGGESGYGSAVLGKVKGYDVFVSDNGKIIPKYTEILDKWEIPYEQEGHTIERILEADLIVKSPGIPDTVPVVRQACGKNIRVVSEIEFAGQYLGKAKTVCITGSNGKTTTTTLTHKILREAGYNVALGGNIGESFAYSVATGEYDWYVLELSSFQLDGMFDFRADIAVLMNITPDHLDRYEHKMENYVESKMRVIRNQQYYDYFIWCDDDVTINHRIKSEQLPMRALPFSVNKTEEQTRVHGHGHGKWQGAHMAGDDFVVVVGDRKFAMPVAELKIKGKHNIYNAMAATLAAMAAGVEEESIRESLRSFTGVEHRLEYVATVAGVDYVNDSKGTNVDSVWYALESMTKPVVWIAGGTDKGNDYAPLMDFAREKVRVLVAMGVDNEKLKKSFEGVVSVIYDTKSIDEALDLARSEARPGEVVLLSPACASFDLFKNYEDRGRQFKEKVAALSDKK